MMQPPRDFGDMRRILRFIFSFNRALYANDMHAHVSRAWEALRRHGGVGKV